MAAYAVLGWKSSTGLRAGSSMTMTAARSLDGLTREACPLGSETLNCRVEIGNDDLEPIPPSRLRNPTGFARAAYARLVEK